jgi:hypothetical protein
MTQHLKMRALTNDELDQVSGGNPDAIVFPWRLLDGRVGLGHLCPAHCYDVSATGLARRRVVAPRSGDRQYPADSARPRRNHVARWRGGHVAADGACAAAGDAGSRVPWHPIARRNGRPCARIAPGPERNGHFEKHVWRVGDILMWDNRCTLRSHRLQRARAPPDAASDDPRREAAMSRPQYRLRSSSSVRCPCCRGRCGAASCRRASRPD